MANGGIEGVNNKGIGYVPHDTETTIIGFLFAKSECKSILPLGFLKEFTHPPSWATRMILRLWEGWIYKRLR